MPLAAPVAGAHGHAHKSAKGLLKAGGLHGIHHAGNIVPHPKKVAAALHKPAKPAAPKFVAQKWHVTGTIGGQGYEEPIDIT
eukprot:gene13794-1948_t